MWAWTGAGNTWCEPTNLINLRELYASAQLKSLRHPETVPFPMITCLSSDISNKRLLVTLATSVLLEMAVDSTNVASVLAEGLSHRVTALVAHPTEPYTVVTADEDGLLKVSYF